jgi:rfaE bifunctional protein kinase chain/domain/rfaE bifunctional protein nucleotidyltransferase chain/domain
MKNKLLKIEDIKKKVSELKKKKLKIVHCHGVFDIVHIGHIKHLKKAKDHGDILIVTVTSDKFVNKGLNRPIFNQKKRLEFLSELESVDFVCLSNFPSATNLIKLIKPHIYVKGQDYKNSKDDKTGKINFEAQLIKKFGGKIIFTYEETFSSSNIINDNFSYTVDQLTFLRSISKKYSSDYVEEVFKKISRLKILVIGETIIDQYNFCEALGKSGKEPYLAMKDISSENYLGGAAAIANNLADFSKKIKLISVVGEKNEYKNFIQKNLNKKIKTFFFKKDKSPTILKKRFLDNVNKAKLFGIYSINDDACSPKDDAKIKKYIDENIKNFDLIIVSDYGHGFISKTSAKKISKAKKFVALNAQINASNIGYHSLQNYKNIDATIINETEVRHEMRNKNEDIKSLSLKLQKKIKTKNLIVTRGNNGAMIFNNKDKSIIECPAFANKVLDKVGAGDTMLSILSMLIKVGTPNDLALLIGSFAGVYSVETMGNSYSLNKKIFLRHLEFALK